MSDPSVIASRDGRIGHILLNRPKALNALDLDMMRAIQAALEAELRLTRTALRHIDFAEGVRAMVIDKDRNPTWSPSRIEEVDHATIEEMLK